jgi:anti-sigma factor RsiW
MNERNPVSDTDLELLETYLDGELPMSEAEGLWRRLAKEPELSAELDQLRADRATRSSMWESCEPDEDAARLIVGRVSASVARRRWVEGLRRSMVRVAAAAACILIGVQIGWMEHHPEQATQGQQLMSQVSPAGLLVPIHDDRGNIIGVPVFQSPQEASQFTRDVNALQTQPQPEHESNQNVVPASDEQY